MYFFLKAISKSKDVSCLDFPDIYDKISEIFFINKEILREIIGEEEEEKIL